MTLGRKIIHNFLTQNSHVYVDNLFCSPVTPLEVRTLTGNFQKLLAQVKTVIIIIIVIIIINISIIIITGANLVLNVVR